METSSIAVLIPAAGRTMPGSTEDSPALSVVAGRPVIQWSLEYLSSKGFAEFHIGVPSRESTLRDFVELRYGQTLCISVHELDTLSVGETLCYLARATQAESILVVLGDTYVEFAPSSLLGGSQPVVWTQTTSDARRWCAIMADEDGRVAEIHDKVDSAAGPVEAAVGAYYFPSRDQLLTAITDVDPISSDGIELASILEHFAWEGTLWTERPAAWFDAGHSDLKWASTRQLLSSRSFNRLSVDEVFGTVTKRSSNADKLINEINYLRLLPDDLAMLYPRLGAFSVQADDVWVTQEFYAYPTLAEYFLYHTLDDSVWERAFVRLKTFLVEEFPKFKQPLTESAIREMYLGKLLDRTASLTSHQTLGPLTSSRTLRLNGSEYRNIPLLLPMIEETVARLSSDAVGTVIHGDLCFSNILYDVSSSVCRLIDPRGSFGTVGIGGDLRYDVAKLWHSIAGGYDFLANDFFNISIQAQDVQFRVPWRPQHHRLQRLFRELFATHFDFADISLIAGLMMCSLPALHAESTSRQAALYVSGLLLVHEGLEGGRADMP